jgi:hypothetical protein
MYVHLYSHLKPIKVDVEEVKTNLADYGRQGWDWTLGALEMVMHLRNLTNFLRLNKSLTRLIGMRILEINPCNHKGKDKGVTAIDESTMVIKTLIMNFKHKIKANILGIILLLGGMKGG